MNANINADRRQTQINPDDCTLQFVNSYGRTIPFYDDGYGPLWLYRDADGIMGIVRCQSESDAWGIVSDEFLPEVADEDIPDAYGAWDMLLDGLVERGHKDTLELRRRVSAHYRKYFRLISQNQELIESDGLELIEGYEYAPNGPRETGGSGIRSYSLNGQSLEPLTVELLERLELTMSVTFGD